MRPGKRLHSRSLHDRGVDAKKAEVDVAPDGKILQVEEKVAPAELPDAVKMA